jgi:hypothetical protein
MYQSFVDKYVIDDQDNRPSAVIEYIPMMTLTSYLNSLASIDPDLKTLLGTKVTNAMLARCSTLEDLIALGLQKLLP